MRGITGFAAALSLLTALHAGARASPVGEQSAALSRSLATAEHRLGRSAPQLLPILAPLAQLRFEQGEFAEATALRRRALKIAIAAYGSASVPSAEAMAGLARLYIAQRRYLDAEPLVIAAANVLRDRLGKASPALAAVAADRARIALARGDDDAARNWAEQAIAIDKQDGGAPHGDRLRVQGEVLVAEGAFADGERALREALALDRAAGDRLATARDLAGLGNAYLRQQRFSDALPAIEEAAWIDQGHLGAAHPLVAEDFHTLGQAYLALDRPADAAKALHTAIDVLERGAGRDTPALAYTELDLARAEHALGHDDKAEALFNNARRVLNGAEDEERDRQRQA